MNSALHEQWAPLVEPALRDGLPGLKRVRPATWSIAPRRGRPLGGGARVCEDWLLIAARVPKGAHVDAWRLLELNAAVSGGAKFVLDGRGGAGLRAEVPLLHDVDLAERTRQCCDGLLAAAALLGGGECNAPAPGEADGSVETVAALCEEAGWPAEDRSGRLSVKLAVSEAAGRATLDVAPGGGVRAITPLEVGDPGGWPPSCRTALGRLVLVAGRVVRMARPAWSSEDGKLCFMLSFDSPPAAAELGHAFSALSVARRLCAREAVALRDEKVAAAYLGAGSPPPQLQNATQQGRRQDDG